MDQMKASNATFLDDNTGGKGKYFRARILQAGLVKYSFGVCLLEKDTIDKFVYNFVGCPVIINHKDVTNENAKEERVGVISRVWFEQMDGWFWVEGVIFDEEAISLINDGYNVSCQYEISEYANNVGNRLHNGNAFDKVILNGKPEHLAIVKNPRYENAMIAVNALDATNEEFRTAKDGHVYPLKRASEYGECNGKKAALVGELANIEKHYESLAQYGKSDNDAHSRANKFALDMLLGKAKGLIEKLDAMNANDEKGRWITIKGTHVFIKKGQTVEDAMKEHGFGKSSKSSSTGEKNFNWEKLDKNNKYSVIDGLSGEEESFDSYDEAKKFSDKLKKEYEKDGYESPDVNIDEVDKDGEYVRRMPDFGSRKKEKSDLEGKYTKEDADFDPEQMQKDIKAAKDLGYEEVEDIAEFLGLDEDEVRETIMDGEGNLKPEFGGDKKESSDKENKAEAIYGDEFGNFSKEQVLEIIRDEHKTGLDWEALRDELFDAYGIALKTGTFTKLRDEALKLDEKKKAKNAIIQAINEIKETDMFSKLFKKKENKMDRDELKSLFMECLSEMVAKNEADKKEEDEKLADDKMAENEEEEMKEEKADNKCKNEEKEVEAKNGCKNEEDEEEKEDEEEMKEKASNSLDEIIGKMSAGTFERKSGSYMTQKKAIELGDKLF